MEQACIHPTSADELPITGRGRKALEGVEKSILMFLQGSDALEISPKAAEVLPPPPTAHASSHDAGPSLTPAPRGGYLARPQLHVPQGSLSPSSSWSRVLLEEPIQEPFSVVSTTGKCLEALVRPGPLVHGAAQTGRKVLLQGAHPNRQDGKGRSRTDTRRDWPKVTI